MYTELASLVAIHVFAWIATAVAINCPNVNLPTFPNAKQLTFIPNQYIVYACNTGFQYATNTEGVLWCDATIGNWTGNPGTCNPISVLNPCIPNPCLSNGVCSTSENPYGWGYFCFCSQPFGGRKCQLDDPCHTLPCPTGTVSCWRTFTNDSGRYCYDANWNLL